MTIHQKRITIEVQHSPETVARTYLIMNVGMNIQLSSIKEITHDKFKVILRAVIPYRIVLKNGDAHVGFTKFNNLGSFFVIREGNNWKVDKSSVPSNKSLDKELEKRVSERNKLLVVKEITWA